MGVTRKQIVVRTVLLALPVVLLVTAFVARDLIVQLGTSFPPCKFYTLLGWYCPGCGNTRSVLALVHGDIRSALRFNLTPVLAVVIGLLFYLEGALRSFGKQVKLVPRKNLFLYLVLGFMLCYFVVRNFIPYLVP